MEWKLFDGDVPHVSTFEFHEHRPRAPHLEQSIHRGRLERAASYAIESVRGVDDGFVVDLGCGDGGLLSLLEDAWIPAYGYDFQPTNASGWVERGVNAEALNFVDHWHEVQEATTYVITEVLEHLADPHGMVKRIYDRGANIVASSPWTENNTSHDECHAWAWDMAGYTDMLLTAGFEIHGHSQEGMFQVIWGTQ